MEFISASELAKRKQDFLLVDVRDTVAFESWHIPGSKNVDVYEDLWGGNIGVVQEQFKRLPQDKPLAVICNVGQTSQHAAGILEQLGYHAAVLEGGMFGWNKLHLSSDIINDNPVVKQIIRPGKGCLSYLIGDASSKACIIVDVSQFIEEYVHLVKTQIWKPIATLDTHVHADHLSGSKILAEMLKIPYYVSSKDCQQATPLPANIIVGQHSMKVLETPGHTAGSVCLLVDNRVLLTGDTLFIEGVGRPDLLREKVVITEGARQLFQSLQIIKQLPTSIIILPAHVTHVHTIPVQGTIAQLLHQNRAFSLNTEQDFIEFTLQHLPAFPPNYEQIKQMNMQGMTLARQMGEQLEFGPNRCAAQ